MADRGFGDQKLFEFLRHTQGFEFIIRIRRNIIVTSTRGESRPAEEWIGKCGRAKLLRNDRLLKSNTVKKRIHSLFRQGCMLYELIPNMPAERLRPLIERFSEMRMAKVNYDWGYDRILGAMANLGYTLSDQTVGNILQRHGIPPAPTRKRTTT